MPFDEVSDTSASETAALTAVLPETDTYWKFDFYLAGGQMFGVTLSSRDADHCKRTYDSYLDGWSPTARWRFPDVPRSDGSLTEVTINFALVSMLHVTQVDKL